MPPAFYSVDPRKPDLEILEKAAWILRRGGLVVFPTETVYGLGADGLNPSAVSRLLKVKGRPPGRPLTLLVGDLAAVEELAAWIPPQAEALMKAFWPGPLTLIFPRRERVPPETVAGGPNVGLRFPDHPVAQALIHRAGMPLAGPSANPSGQPAPTTAAGARALLGDKVDAYLEAGPSSLGVASTVLDLTRVPARLLRVGSVTQADLEQVLGRGGVTEDWKKGAG